MKLYFDIDNEKLSLTLEILFILSCLMESFLYQLLGSTSVFVKNTHQKAADFALQLILAAGMEFILIAGQVLVN